VRLLASIIVGAAIAASILVLSLYSPSDTRSNSNSLYEQVAVVADLGGMTVSIPPHFARYIEYDGDPGVAEPPLENKPIRTPGSKLRSFGFDVRFPDMAGLSTPELRSDKKQNDSSNDSPWLFVGITASEYYPGNGYLDNRVRLAVMEPNLIFPMANYERMQQFEYGLEVYRPTGFDPSTNEPYRENLKSYDEFIFRNDYRLVETSIKCRNARARNAQCQHQFSLEPEANVAVTVSYRRTLLKNWRDIQTLTRELILDFKSDSE
jgi:hypothetical protein